MSDFEAKTQAFNEFLKHKNVSISPKVEIADLRRHKQGRGMVAKESIDEDEVLFSIPQTALLRCEPELRELGQKYELGPFPLLIVKMLASQNDPIWKPYFDILPTEFNTPMFWSQKEAEALLQGSELITKVDRAGADEYYDEMSNGILKEPYFSGHDCSREAYHRMGSLILAYAFDVPFDINEEEARGDEDGDEDEEDEEEEDDKAMVPLADILNYHTRFHNARLIMPETKDGDYQMVASKHIDVGEQVYNTYGMHPTSEMLRRYGYVESQKTEYEVCELTHDFVCSEAANILKITPESLEKLIDERVTNYAGESDLYVIELMDQENSTKIIVDPALLLLVNCVTLETPKFKRPQFKEMMKLSNQEELTPKGADLLLKILHARKSAYPNPLPTTKSTADETAVYLDKADMSLQVLKCELEVLNWAIDYVSSFVASSSKKQKTN